AAVVIHNTSPETLDGLAIQVTGPALADAGVTTPVPPLPPLGLRKVGFRLEGPAPKEAGKSEVEIRLVRRGADKPLDTARLTLQVIQASATQKRTFRSAIDGSVQYYSLVPARAEGGKVGLILTLHGAGVEASGQAACFSPKTWAHVVATTN